MYCSALGAITTAIKTIIIDKIIATTTDAATAHVAVKTGAAKEIAIAGQMALAHAVKTTIQDPAHFLEI